MTQPCTCDRGLVVTPSGLVDACSMCEAGRNAAVKMHDAYEWREVCAFVDRVEQHVRSLELPDDAPVSEWGKDEEWPF